METVELINAARVASHKAYAPYSNFKVGAALMTSDGEIYTGANVENSSYGLTVCAERIAVFKAVTAGAKQFSSIAITTASQKDYIFPCGACLQVLAEFAPDIKVICTNAENKYKIYDLNDLLPQIFTL